MLARKFKRARTPEERERYHVEGLFLALRALDNHVLVYASRHGTSLAQYAKGLLLVSNRGGCFGCRLGLQWRSGWEALAASRPALVFLFPLLLVLLLFLLL